MTNHLITVAEAKAIMNQLPIIRRTMQLPLAEAAGCVLAADVFAQNDIPAFNQSSMDGYAFIFDDYAPTETGSYLQVVSKVPAGSSNRLLLQRGEAARVFTGAPLPEGSDTVVMQEVTEERDGQLYITQPTLKRGDNFRPAGSEIKKGELALEKGTVIAGAAIGFLAGMGHNTVPVYGPPTVIVIITGDELQTPGNALLYGQVYEASSYTLKAILKQMGIATVSIRYVADDLAATTAVLQEALQQADMVLLTGGVSVGEFDFVVKAAENCGVKELFHRVKQRPGKPLYAGVKENRTVLGLPGNPSSVLTCFYQYVWPLLRRYTGHNDQLQQIQAPLAAPHRKEHPLKHFLKGIYANGRVTILTAQESYRMRSFAVANCLVELNEAAVFYQENDIVHLYLLPQYG